MTTLTLSIFITLLSIITSDAICEELIRGVDISTHNNHSAGAYHEYGVPTDALTIFKNHDVNWVRLRLFHSPDANDFGTNMDLDYVTTLGASLKAEGFKFLLDIHYSDTWADPGSQTIPAAWQNMNQAQLVCAVHDDTQNVITHLKNNAAMPDMVQIGNETPNGMLWPNGKISGPGAGGWDQYTDLVKAGIQGVKDGIGSELMPEIMIHIDKGGNQATTQWFFDGILARGVEFDIIGQSFYPEWHGTWDDLNTNLQNMAKRYTQDIVMVEIGMTRSSPEAQKEFIESVINCVEALPSGKGRGVFYWEPSWITDGPGATYRALFEPDSTWTEGEMLMGLEAFNLSDKRTTYSQSIHSSVSGTIMKSHHSDNSYERLTEVRLSGNRVLEHQWIFTNIVGGQSIHIEAFKTANTDGDNFIFSYSTDDVNDIDMFTITKTSDDDTPQSFTFPNNVDGTIYIRVMDTNRTDNKSDKLYVDDMFIFATVDDVNPVANDPGLIVPFLPLK